ncbi:hypothetical protein Vretifemale_497 [Volvox reticuliferus]|uniref:Snurportin-1 n=1 Tax=Volvox reticuliferus TaxID=1737510 RepID=A0A8J4FBP8_9CHLO|nr:hypothetical protein Vretifemale_497 [Volvox reticuliferus]
MRCTILQPSFVLSGCSANSKRRAFCSHLGQSPAVLAVLLVVVMVMRPAIWTRTWVAAPAAATLMPLTLEMEGAAAPRVLSKICRRRRTAYGRVPPPPAAGGVAQPNGTDPWVNGHNGGPASDVELEVDFLRDGLYFLHRHGHYSPGLSTSPLALLWKDLGCSRYLLDTDSSGQPLEHQAITLSYRADRTVATEDDPPVVLGKLPEAFSTAMGDKLKPGRLLRFSIREGGIIFHEGRPAGADLHYEGPANQRRGRADSFSKVLFQRLARTAPITVSMLAAAVTASERSAGGDGSLDAAVAGSGLACMGHGLAMDMACMALE